MNRRDFSLRGLIGAALAPLVAPKVLAPTDSPVPPPAVTFAPTPRNPAAEAIMRQVRNTVFPKPPPGFVQEFILNQAERRGADQALERSSRDGRITPHNIACLRSVAPQHKALMTDRYLNKRYASRGGIREQAKTWGLTELLAFTSDPSPEKLAEDEWYDLCAENERIKLGWHKVAHLGEEGAAAPRERY